MTSEKEFWEIIEASLNNDEVIVGSIEQDEALIQILETKTIDELVGFQLRLLSLRDGLSKKHLRVIAEKLEYNGHLDVFDRFKNGIIASGKVFYYQAKDNAELLEGLLKTNPQILKNCYYEGLGLIASAVFYDKMNSILKREID